MKLWINFGEVDLIVEDKLVEEDDAWAEDMFGLMAAMRDALKKNKC